MYKDQEDKFNKLTTEPVEKLVCKFAIPTIISMLVTNFYNMADTFFVGKINTSATAAVGIVFPLMAIIQAFGFFFGHGSGNFISRELGKRNIKRSEQMAATGFFSAFFAGCIIMIGGFIFINPLLKLLGSTDTILPYAFDYLKYILIGAPFMTASLVLNNQLRFQGNAFFSMIGLVTGAVLNIGLDPLFMFTFKMGIGGAALATIISQFISFCLLFWGTLRSDNLNIKFKNFTPTKASYKEILRGGTPSLCRQGLASVSTICLNTAAGSYGDAAIAAISIVSRIMMFASSALIGFGQGFQPVCGFNYGAGLYKRVKKAFFFCVKTSTGLLVVSSIIGIIFAPQIITIFRRGDADVIKIGAIALRAQMITFPFMSWVVMSNMMMQTIGKVFKASLLAMSRQGLMFIPVILILPLILGLDGIILAQPIADALSVILSLPLQFSVLKELDRQSK